ncbi:MAG: hypothetical protein GY850_48355, partial [bacterium]|nr:hypothetical protein [bacterium]
EIAGVKVLENTKEILISGISEGSTNLIIWDKNDQKKSVMIQVVAQSPGRIAREVRDILSGIEGIKVKALGTRVVIDGTVFRESDLKKITQIAEMYPQVTSLATLSPTVLDIVATQINNEFQKSGLDELKAVRIGSKIVIEGDVPNEQAKKKAEMIAAAFGIEAMNFADVGISMEKMVVVKVDFIEISKGDMKNLGIKWADSMNI